MTPAATVREPLPTPPGFLDAWARSHPREQAIEALELMRGEHEVLVPCAMGAMPPTRLSFAHSLVRRMCLNRWRIQRSHLSIDGDGTGTAVYTVAAEGFGFHFGIFARPATPGPRHGRLRENEFDFFGTLIDGPIDLDHLAREEAEAASRVWRGRTTSDTYGWSFANRSERLFDHVVDRLAEGRQPDAALMRDGGYLVRNAGFYGNGRHATRAWLAIPAGHPLDYPYHVDLFCLYLWRIAGCEIAEAAAGARSDRAVALAPELKRYLGIGNSSGIGTVAALVRWPSSLSGFTFARELVLAHAKARPGPPDAARLQRLLTLVDRARLSYAEQPPREHGDLEQPADVAAALGRVGDLVRDLERSGVDVVRPWMALADDAAAIGSREAYEQLNALLIEIHPEAADAVAEFIPVLMRLRRTVAPEMTVEQLEAHLRRRYDWALSLDLDAPGAREHFWYKSEENGENRRGMRAVDPGVEHETFVDVAGAVQALQRAIAEAPDDWTVGRFLLTAPEHALAVSRVQMAARLPYAEVRANLIRAGFRPSDAIRYFLSVLGIERPDPASVQWVRGVFFQGAPLADELRAGAEPDWILARCPGT